MALLLEVVSYLKRPQDFPHPQSGTAFRVLLNSLVNLTRHLKIQVFLHHLQFPAF